LLILAAALAARFPRGGSRIPRLSGLARAAPAALVAHQGSQGNSRRQFGREPARNGLLGCAMVSLPVRDFALKRSEGISISEKDSAMKRRKLIWLLALLLLVTATPVLAQVDRVTADARGIT
jgi:hypothetical protein